MGREAVPAGLSISGCAPASQNGHGAASAPCGPLPGTPCPALMDDCTEHVCTSPSPSPFLQCPLHPCSSQRSDLEQDIPLPQYNYPQSLKDTIRHVPGTGTNNEWARLR